MMIFEDLINNDEENKLKIPKKYKIKKRNLKDMFGLVKNEEKKREKMERIEEDELGFKPDKED